MHNSTFEYLRPTDEQMELMAKAREVFAVCAASVEKVVPASRVLAIAQRPHRGPVGAGRPPEAEVDPARM